MMRELDTISPVVWPAWCYSGEGQGDAESAGANTELPSATATATVATPKPRAKRRGAPAPSATMNGGEHHNHNNSNNNNNNNNPVKTERLSPTTTTANASANTPDNNSSSSRSATPSSSYPGTPPGAAPERGSSPASSPAGHIKHMEQMMTRNYSDFMRSLAAKYNNTNPNDYFSTPARNGYPVGLDPRFTSFKTGATPFVGLMAPLTSTTLPSAVHKSSSTSNSTTSTAAATTATTASTKYSCPDNNHLKKSSTSTVEAQQALYAAAAASNFVTNPFSPGAAANAGMFPPMIDMSSTQTLLNMVRTANAHNASQLETYLKGAIKRPAPSESTPLDLSPASVPSYSKKSRTNRNMSVSDNLFIKSELNIPMMDVLRTTKERLGKRVGSVSPKPPSRSVGNSGGSSAGSSPRLGPSATVTSQHVYGRNLPCMSMCTTATDRPCSGSADSQTVAHWTVDDVCNYVSSIDICAEYTQNFRDQRIDGSSLPLLTEEHLTNTMGMKLGPALKLRATLARRLGHCAICLHCVHCHNPAALPAPVSPAPTPPASTLGRPSSTGV